MSQSHINAPTVEGVQLKLYRTGVSLKYTPWKSLTTGVLLKDIGAVSADLGEVERGSHFTMHIHSLVSENSMLFGGINPV